MIGLNPPVGPVGTPVLAKNPIEMKPLLAPLLFVASLHFSQAATLQVSGAAAPNSTTGTSLLLPSGANTDWGYFSRSGASGATSTFNANNTSSDGARVFTVTAVNSGNVRGPTDTTVGAALSYFDFTNGTSTVSTTDARPTGVFNSQLGSDGVTALAGVQLNLTGFTTQSQIQIWTFGYNATGLFEVFVNGAAASFSESVSTGNPGNGKGARLFTLDFTPDSSTDFIDIRYTMTATTDTSSGHVGFQAVAIAPIPEPAAVSLLGLAGALGLIRRRR